MDANDNKKDRLENLKMFNNIDTYETFSEYSSRLDRLFQKNTLRTFIHDLKENKKHKIIGLKDVFENDEIKKEREIQQKRKDLKFNLKKSIEMVKAIAKNEEEKSKHLFKNRKFNFNKKQSLYCKTNDNEDENLPKISDSADIGLYHPNYNSIYKNPTNTFISPPKEETEVKSIDPYNALCSRKKKQFEEEHPEYFRNHNGEQDENSKMNDSGDRKTNRRIQ